MYLPRQYISTLYLHLKNTRHTLSPPVQILVALEPDALCACRILTHLLKRDYIPHKIQPIAGYGDLEQVGNEHVKPMMESQGGSGGVVVCLGVGGLVDLAALMGLEDEEDSAVGFGGVEIWVIDARRPWNLGNVFGVPYENDEQGEPSRRRAGVESGRIERGYKPGKGGVIVFDDGDIDEELGAEKTAYMALLDMPRVEDDGEESDESESEDDDEEDVQDKLPDARTGKKRKSWEAREEDEESSDDEDGRPRQRRRSNSSSPILDSPRRPNQRGLLSLADRSIANSRSASPTPAQPPKPESARKLRRRFLRLRRQHESVLQAYYSLGTSYSEPISSMMYSLASELGREDNDILWLTIIGVTSMEVYGRSSQGVAVLSQKSNDEEYPTQSTSWLGQRGSQLRQLLRDEVRRLNPPELSESSSSSLNRAIILENSGIIPTTAKSPTDNSIRLSPEPKLLLVRHWSLEDSMMHSPYIAARMKIWNEDGRKKLKRFVTKMGVSIVQSKQSYTHMDMELKRGLREKFLRFSKLYGLDDLVPASGSERGGASKEGWGFVRSYGWRATLSAHDVSVVVGSILEVGLKPALNIENGGWRGGREREVTDTDGAIESREWVQRFFHAYDALEKVEDLKAALPITQHLHRAILRAGTAIIEKKSIRHLRAFRFCMLKEGLDVQLFTHPSALTKLALWIGEACYIQDRDDGKGRGTPLVAACLNEGRGVYVIVGTGGGGGGLRLGSGDKTSSSKAKQEEKAKAKEENRKAKALARENKRKTRRRKHTPTSSDSNNSNSDSELESESSESSESEEEEEVQQPRGHGRNRFGNAFQEVVAETSARVRIDSFEHCVVEVKKEDLENFLTGLSMKAVVG